MALPQPLWTIAPRLDQAELPDLPETPVTEGLEGLERLAE